jgi:hypothetical protein
MHMDSVFLGTSTPATLTQSLSGLSTSGQTYKLAFYLWRYNQDVRSTCTLNVSLGTKPLYTQVLLFDSKVPFQGYALVAVNAILPTSQDADLVFTYTSDNADTDISNVISIDDVAFGPVLC